MKKLLGLVIVLTILVIGGYYGMGFITERTIQKNIEIVNQSNGLMVDLSRYDRGWFTSLAELNWRIHIPEHVVKNANGETSTVAAQDFVIQTPVTIYHGPFMFTPSGPKFGLGYAHSNVELPKAYIEKFNTLFTDASTKPQLELSLFVNYLNNSRLHIKLPAFTLISKQNGDEFKWEGMDTYFSLSSNLRHMAGDITVTGATITKNKINATFGKISSNYDLHQTDAGIYLGDANISLPKFVVTENGQQLLDMDQFQAHSSSDIENGLFHSSFSTSLKKVVAHDKVYGPAQLVMSIKNLDAQILGQINAQANTLQQGSVTERQKALIAILPELPKLFSKGAEFEISKLNLVVPEGVIDGKLIVSLPKGDTNNPFQLLQKVEGHGLIKVPAVLLKRVITASLKQKLLAQPTLSQAVAEQMKNAGPPPQSSNATANNPAVVSEASSNPIDGSTASANNTPADVSSASKAGTPTNQDQKPLTVAEVEQQATAQADEKLSAMIQSGLLVLQGSEYVVKVELLQGQLSVNDKPFTPAMMQF